MTESRTELTSSEEELFRQVHPAFAPGGVPTSQAFTPTKKDKGFLSLDRGSKTSAKRSFDRFVALGHPSAFVLAVSVGDFAEVQDEQGKTTAQRIPVFDDPNPESDPENNAHAEADFNVVSKGAAKNRAKLLLAAAKKMVF